MGIVYYKMDKYSEALKYYQRSLSITQLAKGKDYIKCARRLYNIGNVYRKMEKYDEALQHYKQATDIRSRVKGREDREHLHILQNMIIALLSKKERTIEERVQIRI